jgi:hypothetical protein
MRNDVHLSALRAAARVAFSVALLNGCSSPDVADEAEGSSDALKAAKMPPKEPCCNDLLSKTFPVPGDYQWEPVPQPADVVACCEKELATAGADSKYRWDCCVAYDPAVDPDGTSTQRPISCTPWGPPVPPSMKRKNARKRAADSALLAVA